MITKVALLPRILPGLFHLPTAATPAGYRMPHERYFVYAAAFSVLLHVAVLNGFRNPPPPPPHGGPDVGGDVGRVWERPLAVELTPPPPPETPATSKPDKPTDPAEAEDGASRATIPELLSPLIPGLVTITGDLNPNGVAPIKGSLRWEVPKNAVSAAPKGPKGGFVPLEDLDEKPVATNRISPRYPSEMRRNGIEGVAVLRFIVDSHGEVAEVEIVRADTTEFGKAAADAMLRWKFKPGMKNRRRVDTRMEMPMSFTLEKGA